MWNSKFIQLLLWWRLDKNALTYAPHNKDWIKEKIYVLLRKQAGK